MRHRGRRTAGPGPVRAVVLDCLGTLVELEPPGPRLRDELRRRGIEVSEASARAAFRSEIAYYLDHHLEGSDALGLQRLRDACARVVADQLGLSRVPLAIVREALLAALRFSPYPDVAPALAALRDAGLRLVVASNWDCSLPSVLERTGLRALVDGAVTSAEVGAAKPDPAVFRTALELARCAPDAALCVGDSLERDVAGASAAGIEALLLVRPPGDPRAGAAGRRPAPRGVAVVRSLDEVRSIILTTA